MKDTVLIDIDGCISDDRHRRFLIDNEYVPLDERYRTYHDNSFKDSPVNKEIVEHHRRLGHRIVFITGRPEEYRMQTWNWLTRHFPDAVKGDSFLYMRPDLNVEPSGILKARIVQNNLGVDRIVAAYDDREDVIDEYATIGITNCALVQIDGRIDVQIEFMTDTPTITESVIATPTVPDILKSMASTFEERNKLYGAAYKRHGDVMAGLFPEGVTLRTEEEFNRYGVLVMIVSKLNRYASNLTRGGHKDSAHDMAVYAAMLEEMTK